MRIWLEVSHHQAFRVGGWAFVRDEGGVVTGTAGGDRRLDAERTALMGLLAALNGVKLAATVQTASPLVASIPARIIAAKAGDKVPTENLDLWAQATTALSTGHVKIVRTPPDEKPVIFCAAWAELGRDKAKDRGPFSSAIPKPNLAKAGV